MCKNFHTVARSPRLAPARRARAQSPALGWSGEVAEFFAKRDYSVNEGREVGGVSARQRGEGSRRRHPGSGVVRDAAGNLYGTTRYGGTYSGGVVFKLAQNADGSWSETVLYNFLPDGQDGDQPSGPLILDPAGNLYGTTVDGGHLACDQGAGCGVVFKITPQ